MRPALDWRRLCESTYCVDEQFSLGSDAHLLEPAVALGAVTPDPDVTDDVPKDPPPALVALLVVVTPFPGMVVPAGGVMPPVGVTVPGIGAAPKRARVVVGATATGWIVAGAAMCGVAGAARRAAGAATCGVARWGAATCGAAGAAVPAALAPDALIRSAVDVTAAIKWAFMFNSGSVVRQTNPRRRHPAPNGAVTFC